MPKLKTHKATSKRFRYTGGGKLLRTKIGKSHLRRKKARRVKALFDQMLLVEHAGSRKHIQRLAPYLHKQ
jgi:large subunit ribosomal protein L35